MSLLDGRYAVVTGAGGGIGGAAAGALARAGASGLLLVDRDADALARAAASLEDAVGGATRIETMTADVAVEADVRGYVGRALDAFGQIDVFFNNAGIHGALTPLVEYPTEEFDRIIAVNLRGVFLGLKHVLPPMLERGRGSIINTGSIASERGLPSSAAYVAAKHGVLGLTRVAATECGASGVRVNAVLPGMIDTQMFRSIVTTLAGGDTEAGVAAAAAAAPVNRPGSAEEVAAVVLFLASDEASFVNGAGWPVDGGVLATVNNGGEPS